jgi:hypothetical protein
VDVRFWISSAFRLERQLQHPTAQYCCWEVDGANICFVPQPVCFSGLPQRNSGTRSRAPGACLTLLLTKQYLHLRINSFDYESHSVGQNRFSLISVRIRNTDGPFFRVLERDIWDNAQPAKVAIRNIGVIIRIKSYREKLIPLLFVATP